MNIWNHLAALTLCVSAISSVLASVVPGEWNANFNDCRQYAEANNVPLVLILGNQSCGHCSNLLAAVKSEVATEWFMEHEVVMCVKHDPYKKFMYQYSDDYRAAYSWLESLKSQDWDGLPRVGVYWGKNLSGETVSVGFTGRVGDMPAKTPKFKLAEQFVNSLDQLIGDYAPVHHGAFACGDTQTDHLEANGLSKEVNVPFKRDGGSAVAEKLVVTYPVAADREPLAQTLNWAKSQTSLNVSVPVQWAEGLVGQKLELALYDADDNLLGTSHIWYVDERECSVAYPRFIGEDFAYGEWTMDYAAAQARVAKDGGCVLALFTGTMWCPYCYGLDKVFTDSRFIKWSQDNKVALVTFDQGLASSPSTAEGTHLARLLSYTAGTDHYKAGQDPAGAGVLRSGAYYLSGKGITATEAASAMAVTTQKTKQWLSPESASARCGNPTLMLIKNDKVVGRFAPLRNGYDYDIDETLARFDDLLVLAARDDEFDDYRTSTTRTIQVSECPLCGDVQAETMKFQVSDTKEWFDVAATKKGEYSFYATAPDGKSVTLSLYSDTNLLQQAVGSLSVRVTSSQAAKGLALKVTGYANTSGQICLTEDTSIYAASVYATYSDTGSQDEDGPGFDEDGKPCFGWEDYDVDVLYGASISKTFNLVNIEKATSVSLVNVSGSLPAGLKLQYDRSTKRAVLSGSSKKKSGSYTVSYSVKARIGSKYYTGIPSTFTITFYDPADLNDYLGKARTDTVPLLTDGHFAGQLSVSITKANKITAKYIGTESKTLSFSGSWSEVDAATGEVRTTLTTRDGQSLDLSMDAEGVLLAELELDSDYTYFADDDTCLLSGSVQPASSGNWRDFAGYYTVTLPAVDDDGIATGTSYLTLKMATATAYKKGTVTYSGVMPNGMALSGSAQLSQYGENALLPIFVQKSGNVFAALIVLTPNADETWGEAGSEKIWTVRTLSAPYFLCRQTKGIEYLAETALYGGYYKTSSTPEGLAELYGLDTTMSLAIGEIPVCEMKATSRGFTLGKASVSASLSFNKSTGTFSGTATVLNSQGKSVKGTIAGVLMPGWLGCGACGGEDIERPFGSGTLYYTDTVNKKKVTVSVPVDINAVEREEL